MKPRVLKGARVLEMIQSLTSFNVTLVKLVRLCSGKRDLRFFFFKLLFHWVKTDGFNTYID